VQYSAGSVPVGVIQTFVYLACWRVEKMGFGGCPAKKIKSPDFGVQGVPDILWDSGLFFIFDAALVL